MAMEKTAKSQTFAQTLAQTKENAKAQPRLTAAELVWIFTLGCLVGFVAETLFCFIFKGAWESRRAMLYGPFNQVYGFGGVLMVVCLRPFTGQPWQHQLVIASAMGGVLEVSISLFEQLAFGTRSWEYSFMPFAFFGGRTNLLYMLLFGILGVLFLRLVMPFLRRSIAAIPPFSRRAGAIVLAVFFAVNLSLSAAAVTRWTARQRGVEAATTAEQWLDATYPDERMREIYPVMEVIEE